MLEYIRFILFCALIATGVILEYNALIGVNRFGFALNRLHAASIGDTLGLMCITLACIIKSGINLLSVKFAFVYLFMLITSPMSSHLISLLVYRTDKNVGREAPVWKQ